MNKNMKEGYLSKYFESIAVKRLSAVEANREVSNQHEFNGISPLKQMLGTEEKRGVDALFLYLTENENTSRSAEGFLTWYDARINHETRSEYRLYFSSTPVSRCFRENDLVVIGKRQNGKLIIIATEQGSTAEHQILWLFGIRNMVSQQFTVKDLEHDDNTKVGVAARIILERLEIDEKEINENYLPLLLQHFGGNFPKTAELSTLARELCDKDIDPRYDPDLAIVEWMEKEEILFNTIENHVLSSKLDEGFGEGEQKVERFCKFALSVLNRRKSRAGQALEHHLEAVFMSQGIKYSRNAKTENGSRPDFIFPGIDDYYSETFDNKLLTLLGAKLSCKDRWRQVLNESGKIGRKHLFTLQPGISANQMDEMQASNLQLVIPKQIHGTFKPNQRSGLMNLKDFIELVIDRQKKAYSGIANLG